MNEDRFHILVDSIPQLIWEARADGSAVFNNRRMLEYLDKSPEQIKGWGWLETIHPDDVQRVRESWLNSVRTGKEYSNEFRLRNGRTGEHRWFLTRAVPHRNQQGHISRWFGTCTDIHKSKQIEHSSDSTVAFLSLLNESKGIQDLIRNAIEFIHEKTGCHAVGIRLKKGPDFPYYESRGFPKEFILLESSLCSRDQEGQLCLDAKGNPILECMCGNVICGRFDPAKPFFTARGTFWTHSTSALLAQTTETDRQARTRNRCHGEGYESVVLIALRTAEEPLGLLQLNDKRTGFFSTEAIRFWERMADYLSVALSRLVSREALRESEAKTRSIFLAAPIGIGLLSNRKFLDVNQRMCEITGYTRDELVGRNARMIYPTPEDYEYVGVEKYRQIAKRGTGTVETRFQRKDGAIIDVLLSSTPLDPHDHTTGVTFTVLDITERKQAIEALRESEEKLRLALDAAQLGTWEFNPKTGETLWDERSRAIYGLLPGEPINQTRFLTLVHPEDRERIAKGILIALDSSETRDRFEARYRILREDGAARWISVAGKTYFDDEGSKAVRVIGTHKDITELKQAEEELQKLNESLERQVAERTELAEARSRQLQALAVELVEAEERERRRIADLLHEDLQQLLASAKFEMQAISESLPLGSELGNVERILSDCIDKSRMLTHELSPNVVYHSINTALEWLCRQMNQRFGIDVQLDVGPDRWVKNTHLKVFIFRAVKELLFNIVKHAGVKTARVAISYANGDLAVIVSDQGEGFDPSVLEKITPKGGLGLLSLRERASYIGGRLMIESAPDKGSRITLSVPLKLTKKTLDPLRPVTDSEEKALPQTVEVHVADVSKIRVLFVDDHKVMRQGLIRLISGKPDIVVVGEAGNGREALELARQLVPDVIVMDVSMPEMDGIEATRRIKAEMPQVRVIGLSMYDDAHIAKTMRDAGAEAFVSKAASSAELLKAIYGMAVNNSSGAGRSQS
jgi:PAS domain S-box-containing protein